MVTGDFAALLDVVGVGVIVVDSQNNILTSNRLAANRDPAGAAAVIAEPLVGNVLDRARRLGQPADDENYVASWDAWLRVDAVPTDGEVTLVLRDVTTQRRAERFRDACKHLEASIDPDSSLPDALAGTAEALRTFTGAAVVEAWFFDSKEMLPRPVACAIAEGDDTAAAFGQAGRTASSPRSPLAQSVRTFQPVLVDDLATEPHFQRPEAAAAAGLRSAMYMPVDLGHQVLLAIAVFVRDRRDWGDSVHLLGSMRRPISRLLSQHRAHVEVERCFDVSHDLLAIVTADGIVRRVNRTTLEVLGYKEREVVGRHFSEMLHPDDAELASTIQRRASFDDRSIDDLEGRAMTRDGEFRWICWNAVGSPDVGLLYASGRDVTAERERLRDLRDSEERFRLLANATEDAIWDWDMSAGIQWRSQGFQSLFGYAVEDIGPSVEWWSDRVHPDDRDRVLNRLEGDLTAPVLQRLVEYRFRRSDGTYAEVLDRSTILRGDDGRPVRMVGGMTDISERRELERQYLRVQRVESVGTLAGGIAHDLNNSLTPIMMATELLRAEPLSEHAQRMVDLVETSAKRSADMVRQILSYARGLDGQRRPVRVDHLVDEVVKMLGDAFPKTVDIVYDVPGLVPVVTGDPTQLHQVLVNLALNARDAMNDHGTVTISVTSQQVGGSGGSRTSRSDPVSAMLTAGPYVRVDVADQGPGIAPAVLDRLFEPFFTTKEPGRGTGLGLPTSLAIVRSHGGTIRVKSEPGRGATFSVYLPVEAQEVLGHEPSSEPHTDGRDSRVILVVDDEQAVREVVRGGLEAAGHRVLLAGDGDEALRVLAEAGPVDVVLTDVMMAGMDGIGLAATLMRRPDAPTIVAMTGLSDDARVHALAEAGVRQVLHKPFDRAALLAAIDQAMGRARNQSAP